MDHFGEQNYVFGGLEELHVGVVSSADEGRAGVEAEDAPVPCGEIFRGGSGVCSGLEGRLPLLAVSRQWRQASVWWIHDQRGAVGRHHFGSCINPEPVIGAWVSWRGRSIDELVADRLIFQPRDFLRRQHLSALKLLWPL
jgi:hypothetical protein